MTNQEKLKELQQEKRNLEIKLKSIESDIALYSNLQTKLENHKSTIIKEQLLDVFNIANKPNMIEAQLTKNKNCVNFYLGFEKTPFYTHNFITEPITSEIEYQFQKESFEQQIKNVKSYLFNLQKVFQVMDDMCTKYGQLSITRPYVNNDIFKFTYFEGFHKKYIATLKFNDFNESIDYTMTKLFEGYSYQQTLQNGHSIKLKSDSYENKINMVYNISNTCSIDKLKESLSDTFAEFQDTFENITIEID
jgi:hypothetical protein